MEEKEFKYLSTKDKILSIIMMIVLCFAYLFMIAFFIILIPIRNSMWTYYFRLRLDL